MYTESRHNIPVNEWPPYHPKDYTPSVIYEEGCEIIATAENKHYHFKKYKQSFF